ncbi:hypothetical protein Peur_062372 [Populus x canadensis]
MCTAATTFEVNDETSWRQLGTKFDAFPKTMVPLLQHAHQAGMEVAGVAGVSFHGVAQHNMPPTNIINVGGAFKANPLSDEIGATVNDAIQEFLPDDKSFEVIAEPRRYFCETAFTL